MTIETKIIGDLENQVRVTEIVKRYDVPKERVQELKAELREINTNYLEEMKLTARLLGKFKKVDAEKVWAEAGMRF